MSLRIVFMKTILQRYKIGCVWHFTDMANMDLIGEQQGLLSWGELQRRGITPPTPGGNDWSHDADRFSQVHDYVHLAFLNDHPMLFVAKKEGRITTPVWLKIDSSILLDPGVRFSSDVSNKAGVQVLNAGEAKDQIDFEVLFTRTDWNDPAIKVRRKAALKSEVLVPRFVPLDRILEMHYG